MKRYLCATTLALTLLLTSWTVYSFAEDSNPFGNVNAPPPPSPTDASDFQQDNDGGGSDMGLGAPPPGSPPPPPVARPNLPSRRSFPPPAMPSSSASTTTTTTSTPAKPVKTPKLADYLELDESIKGLQVKNFDLPDKDIRDVVTLISKWTGKNFILDSKVRGKITIIGPSQVTLQEAYQAFLSALDANGFTTVEQGKFIRVIESAEARHAPLKTYAGNYAPKDDQYITRIFQLKYINSDEVQREFRDMTSRQGKLFAYGPTNSIIITDTGANIDRIKGILDTLDVKGFETTLHVLRIKHGAAKAISEMLGEIYGEGGKAGGTNFNGPRQFKPNAVERTRGGGIISKIIPDEATNSLIVMANQAGFDSLRALVEKLDIKVTDTGKIHVYYCEYAKASDLASTLASLAQGGGGGSTRKSSSSSSSPFGGGGPGGSPFGGGGAFGNQNRGGFGGSTSGSSGSSGPVTAQLGDGIKVTSDDATNALVITANAADYQTIRRVIKKLDIPRLQVFVETAILEIRIDNNKQFGNNLAIGVPGRGFGGGFIGDTDGITSLLQGGLPPAGTSIPIFAGPSFQANVTNTPTSGGAPVTNTITVSTFMGFLRFLTENTATSILSTPQIIALDNEKAQFKVQDETPVGTGVTALPGATSLPLGVSANVERLKTGIQIELTPHVNASSRSIRMEIKQQVDSISNSGVPAALQSYQKATTSRVTDTTVVVKDRDFVMLGGLLQDQVNDSTSKIPLLGDIPILGWLFKSTKHEVIKTNLVILMRPKIIGTTVSAAAIVKENLDKRDQFLDQNASGDDAYKDTVSHYRADLQDQMERGSKDKTFDYRNNADEDADESKVPPGQESELDPRGDAGSDDNKSNTVAAPTNPAGPPPTPGPGGNENVPLIIPPPANNDVGGR